MAKATYRPDLSWVHFPSSMVWESPPKSASLNKVPWKKSSVLHNSKSCITSKQLRSRCGLGVTYTEVLLSNSRSRRHERKQGRLHLEPGSRVLVMDCFKKVKRSKIEIRMAKGTAICRLYSLKCMVSRAPAPAFQSASRHAT